MSASMGISLYPDNATDIDTLIQQADAAMYKAKQAGRSTFRFFSADMDRLAEQRLEHSAALRNAIANDMLQLHYQPQIRTSDGAIHGVEALARWYDPVLGEVSPSKFIPLAEECGLIEQIGLWSIREACRQMAEWRAAGLDIPCVAVNLSPINFQNENLASVGRRHARRTWAAAGSADARDHRRRDHERALGRDRDHERHSQARRRPFAGRFRHRLFEPQPAGASADPRAEDRPQFHARRRERRHRAGDRHHRGSRRPEPATHRGRRRRRDRRAAAIC